jgi:hypothetical protein
MRAAALAPAFLLAGCLAAPRFGVSGAELEALERGEISPCRIIFIVPGILNDLGSPWCEDLQVLLTREGIGTAIVLRYWTTPIGMWTNSGSVEPGRLIAVLADEITRLHVEAGCPEELSFCAVGFSHGCEVLIEAGQRASRAGFDRFLLLASSGFAGSGEGAELLRSGRVEDIVCVYSPLDLVTLLAPLGQGTFGGRGVRNERTCRFHSPFFSRRCLNAIRSRIAWATSAGASRPDYTRSLIGLLRSLNNPGERNGPSGVWSARPGEG